MHANRQHLVTTFGLACALVAFAAPLYATAATTGSLPQQTATARARLGAMQKDLGSTLAQFNTESAQLAQTRTQIAENQTRLAAVKKSMDRGQSRLDIEADFLYRTDGNGFTDALLSAGSFEQFANRLYSLGRVANADAELIGQMRSDRVAAERLATVLAQREQHQAELVAQVSARRATAQSALAAQQAYADSLSASVSKALQKEQSSNDSGGSSTPPAPPASGNSHSVVRATVEGRSGTYAVLASDPRSYRPTGLQFDGKATWYGTTRANERTSSGRAFDENDFTCAHKTLPFGTRIAVSFNGRKVIVVVTDRGPYGKGRVIDLTKHAAAVIGLKSAGVGSVHCEVVEPK